MRPRVAAVSFLNAKPLVAGLDRVADVAFHVPSRLVGELDAGRADVALLPTIHLARPDLIAVPAGGIGCDGPTLTVCLFADRAPEDVRTLRADPDSHTSIALAQVLLREKWGVRALTLVPDGPADATLLIGDKVVLSPPRARHRVDLGAAWKELTGLPFLFACWAARRDADLGDLPAELEAAKRRGLADIDGILDRHAGAWPRDVARDYLTEHLKFDVGPRQLEAVKRFHDFVGAASAAV